MKAIKSINKFLKYCIFMVIFFMLVGITYSYFVANLIGVETNSTILI
jgi:predicted Na+-dependent transporter